ncbi:acyl-CoA dehydrogenase family protein [Streptomyces himastatinicus]|nr:acyl-CoA dehydrogenase family protein [Streptomyces himastatinicus]
MLLDVGTLSTVAAEFAAASDANRVLSPEVAEQLVKSGFARYFVPAANGGTEGSFSELVRALYETSQACASAAWCGLIYATSGRMAAFLPEGGRAAVWRTGADRPIAAALAPAGTAVPARGGWRLSGEWGFLSAVDHADWVLLCVPDPSSGAADPWFMALPRADFTVRDTWFTAGMRGTGSNTATVREAFVPADRAYRRTELATGSGEAPAAACHRVPLLSVAGLPFAAVVAGIARGALDEWTAWTGTRPARESDTTRLLFARAAAETDAAWLLVERAARVADDPELARGHATRNARDTSHAAQLARAVVSRLFESAGSAAQAETNRLQRFWRDAHAAASHAAVRFEHHGIAYARGVWDGTAADR